MLLWAFLLNLHIYCFSVKSLTDHSSSGRAILSRGNPFPQLECTPGNLSLILHPTDCSSLTAERSLWPSSSPPPTSSQTSSDSPESKSLGSASRIACNRHGSDNWMVLCQVFDRRVLDWCLLTGETEGVERIVELFG
jgi:hypothetical protein